MDHEKVIIAVYLNNFWTYDFCLFDEWCFLYQTVYPNFIAWWYNFTGLDSSLMSN